MSIVQDDGETLYLCTDRETRLIYEVKLFQDHVLARPVDPRFYSAIRKMDHDTFLDQFEDYVGNMDQIRQAMNGGGSVVLN